MRRRGGPPLTWGLRPAALSGAPAGPAAAGVGPAAPGVLTVAELTRRIRERLEWDPRLQDLWVRGEVSNLRLHAPSGHAYFSLKDEQAVLRCVMFRDAVQRLAFRPADGMQVVARGRIGVYEREGSYQLYVSELHPHGVGALYVALEQLKARLAAEGLFDPARKRRLPMLPRCVGIVTSPVGAAVRDMIQVARRRFPGVSLVVAPVLVQGDGAAEQVARAIQLLNHHGGVDVIVVARGGGSLEDLWAFNDERVVRAIASSAVPVVTGIGHETDFTLADLAADVRAPTPSAAAELVVPDRRQLLLRLEGLARRLVRALETSAQARRRRLERLVGRRALSHPLDRVAAARQRVEALHRQAALAAARHLERGRGRLQAAAGRLEALSPLGVLARGYSLTRTLDGQVVRGHDEVRPGDTVEVLLQRGALDCRVLRGRPDPWRGGAEAT